MVETNAFDSVYLRGLPEDYGTWASGLAAAAIEPLSSDQTDRWDSQPEGGLLVSSLVTITFLYRQEDPQLRDEAAECLFDTAADALNGQSLAQFTFRASRGSCRGGGRDHAARAANRCGFLLCLHR